MLSSESYGLGVEANVILIRETQLVPKNSNCL